MTRDYGDMRVRLGAGTGRRKVNEIQGYWDGLRRGRLMPARAEVDPRGLERALEFAFILERVAPSVARFRLAGMHLGDLMGMEVRGMPLSVFFAPDARERLGTLTEAVFATPARVEATLRAEVALGKPEMEAHLLLLPLSSEFGTVDRALGCLVAEGVIGRAPRRFSFLETRITPLTTEPVGMRPALSGLSEPPAPYHVTRRLPADVQLAEMTPEERRAMFRIVRSES